MASSIFARIGTIKGESRDARHKDEIEVLSWSWGLSQSGGGGQGEEPASEGDLPGPHLHPSRRQGVAEPDEGVRHGEHIKDATITVRKAGKGQLEYLVITMNDVLVTQRVHERHRRG